MVWLFLKLVISPVWFIIPTDKDTVWSGKDEYPNPDEPEPKRVNFQKFLPQKQEFYWLGPNHRSVGASEVLQMQSMQTGIAINDNQVEQLMISQEDLATITFYAKKYKAQAVYLFGSSLDNLNKANDIDLAVLGIPPNLFFKFYGKLLRHLSKPVDLVDLSQESLFNQLIKGKAVKIYG
jgi:predicted nucleotidyltransferase